MTGKRGSITDFYDVFYYFVINAMLGWILEVAFAFMKQKKYVNRGFLYGPFCPIYGIVLASMALIFEWITLAFFNMESASIWIVFLFIIFWTTLIEGLTGVIMNMIFQIRWWDYSDRFLNIKGYVCLEFSLIWGVLGSIIYKFFNVWVIRFVDYIPERIGEFFLVILVVYFLIDIIYSVKALMYFKKLLLELEEVSKAYILSKCKWMNEVQNIKERIPDGLENKDKGESVESNELTDYEILKLKEHLEVKEIENHYQKLAKQFYNSRLFNIFSDMKSVRFYEHLMDVRKMFRNK